MKAEHIAEEFFVADDLFLEDDDTNSTNPSAGIRFLLEPWNWRCLVCSELMVAIAHRLSLAANSSRAAAKPRSKATACRMPNTAVEKTQAAHNPQRKNKGPQLYRSCQPLSDETFPTTQRYVLRPPGATFSDRCLHLRRGVVKNIGYKDPRCFLDIKICESSETSHCDPGPILLMTPNTLLVIDLPPGQGRLRQLPEQFVSLRPSHRTIWPRKGRQLF